MSVKSEPKPKKKGASVELLISLGLFLLALLPRTYDLYRFVTADEAKWVYRSAQFLAAFLRGEFAGTSVNLTPAVTTTWLGSLGLAIYYWLNQQLIGMSFGTWLLSLPEFRVDLQVLAATRWPMSVLTALAVVALYWSARPLVGRTAALLASVFVAFSPHFLALSRILGHDAPTAVFMPLSFLLVLVAMRRDTRRRLVWVVLSGSAAGLAFLSKAPALFMIPFIALLLAVTVWRAHYHWRRGLQWFLVWSLAAYLTFVVIWPAAWVDPVGQPLAVAKNAFLSATDQDEADGENFWRVPDLGPAYYLVNGLFKLSPLVVLGVAASLIWLLFAARRDHQEAVMLLAWLLTFALLFTIFMTLGTKRSPRYILPIFPVLALVAAWGWLALLEAIGDRMPLIRNNHASRNLFRLIVLLLTVAAAYLIQQPYAPYYFTYFNPLFGGAATAPNLVKLGWGEGLDQTGRFLQREVPGSRVGTPYASTVAPYFTGDLSAVTSDRLDYLILYRKQVQSGEPDAVFIRYFEEIEPVFQVDLNGIHYAATYSGPALQPATATVPSGRQNGQPIPIYFRPLTVFGQIGQPLAVDVVWRTGNPLPDEPATVALQAWKEPQSGSSQATEFGQVLAEGEGYLARIAEDLVVSRHTLTIPDEIPRGEYLLTVNGLPLGRVDVRRFNVPDSLGRINGVSFGDEIGLVGYQFEPTEDYIRVTTAWRAEQPNLPDYTVFVQLLDVDTDTRVAGTDSQPLRGGWPTSRWAKDEIVVDDYLVAIPPDLAPGFYKIIVGLYRPNTGERLQLDNGADHWLLPWTLIWKD